MENKLKTLETRSNFADKPEYTETNQKFDKKNKGKQIVLELEANEICMSMEKNLTFFF